MFGRKPRIPIDILYPISDDLMQKTESDSAVNAIADQMQNVEIGEIEVLEKIDHENQLSNHITEYVKKLQCRLKRSYELLEKNKIAKMNKAKIDFDRKIKKFEYQVGDWVLCSHPKLKRGLSRGLAPRYYGPFVIVAKYANNCNYLIKLANQPKSKTRQIHQNNLKQYFKRGHPSDVKALEVSEKDNAKDDCKKN